MTTPFPNLTAANGRTTSPATRRYNCVAWAVGEDFRWWQPEPELYWPLPDDPAPYTNAGLVRAYVAVGYEACAGGEAAAGFEVVALYGDAAGRWTHAARLLPSGRWTSKLGRLEDIEHDSAEAVGGGDYGEVFAFMRRPTAPG